MFYFAKGITLKLCLNFICLLGNTIKRRAQGFERTFGAWRWRNITLRRSEDVSSSLVHLSVQCPAKVMKGWCLSSVHMQWHPHFLNIYRCCCRCFFSSLFTIDTAWYSLAELLPITSPSKMLRPRSAMV